MAFISSVLIVLLIAWSAHATGAEKHQHDYQKQKKSHIQYGPTGGLYYKDGKLIQEMTDAFGTLQFLYTNLLGRAIRSVLRLSFPSKVQGWYLNTRHSRKIIMPFIKKHSLAMSEFKKRVDQFTSFNDFFIRKLKPEARPIAQGATTLVSPCDSKLLVIPNITEQQHFFVKDMPFNMTTFLQDKKLAELYHEGTLLLFRLAPYDYHRFHAPCDAEFESKREITGLYESVNPFVYNVGIQPLLTNERHVLLLNTTHFGKIAFVIVGAMFVGKIIYTHALPPLQCSITRGDEMGYFAFGGSTVVMLFEKGAIEVRNDATQYSLNGFETAVKMGEMVGVKKQHKEAP